MAQSGRLKSLLLLAALVALAGCQAPQYVSAPYLAGPDASPGLASPAFPVARSAPADIRQAPPRQQSGPALARPAASPFLRGRVVIDPGHGGKDPGTHSAGGMIEKRITLALGLAAAERLKAHGAQVHLTRADDRFIELDDRALSASQFHADLFVSLHADWNPSTAKRGHTILLPQSLTPGSSVAAQDISRSLVSAGWPAYGIRMDTRGLFVLRNTTCPAVLVEIGFLSNPSDAAQLSDPAFQARLGQAIADGIAEYLRSLYRDSAR